jgi:DNA mismatch repair protein MutL
MPRIQQLDAGVVNQIAAGEVIERPASVVKELLENSMDALATRVEVDVAQGGAELIRVVDDGEGIEPDDLLLAVTSHATSKIRSADDLFRVQTMGFRGEALASIASVSRFRVRSRTRQSETGIELEVNCGENGRPQSCGSPPGTLVEVSQLFSNTPVRRKFLRTAATEFGHISEQFSRIVLANPRLHAVLRHNGKTVYELPAAEQLIDRIRLFFGAAMADQFIWVESQIDDVRLWGYVAHPSQSKSTRKGQYLFLNGRWIQDRSLQHALGEAYRGLLMTGRFPIAVLFLEMPPDQVDVNVHPTKAEVRFRDGQQLYRQLLSALRTKFLSMDLDSEMSLRKPSQPVPPPDPAERQKLQLELVDWAKQQLTMQPPPPRGESLPHSPIPMGDATEQPQVADYGRENWSPAIADPSIANSDADQSFAPAAPFTGSSNESPIGDSGTTSGPLQAGQFRAMQIHDCYLVVETTEGITLIDQHALHERVMYEHLRHRVLEGAVESQRMLVPETVDVSPGEAALLIEHREVLAELGFEVEEFGKGTVLLSAYPAILQRADHSRLVRDVAEQLDGPEKNPSRRDILDSLLHMMACKAAVKSGDRLAAEEIESLLEQRHLIDDAHHCPHGRPTALNLSRAELDRQFGRLG